jgi:hypothetical protein
MWLLMQHRTDSSSAKTAPFLEKRVGDYYDRKVAGTFEG